MSAEVKKQNMLRAIDMEFQMWLATWNYRIISQARADLIDEAESHCRAIKIEYENLLYTHEDAIP